MYASSYTVANTKMLQVVTMLQKQLYNTTLQVLDWCKCSLPILGVVMFGVQISGSVQHNDQWKTRVLGFGYLPVIDICPSIKTPLSDGGVCQKIICIYNNMIQVNIKSCL